MFPSNPTNGALPPYMIFWSMLPWACLLAGQDPAASRHGAGPFIEAVEELKRIEGWDDPTRGGQTNYIGNPGEVNPYDRLQEFIAYKYYGRPIPKWLADATPKPEGA